MDVVKENELLKKKLKVLLDAIEFHRKPLCMCFAGCPNCEKSSGEVFEEALEIVSGSDMDSFLLVPKVIPDSILAIMEQRGFNGEDVNFCWNELVISFGFEKEISGVLK